MSSREKASSRPWASRIAAGLLAVAGLALIVFGHGPHSYRLPNGQPARHRVIISYWEKWSGFEAAAMQRVVDRFNASQNHIFVHFVSISQINQKTLIAIAGGDPPDIAGLWASNMGPFIHYHALYPLTRMVQKRIVGPHTYFPYLWRLCAPYGTLYALPSTPETCALFWNKTLFAKAGLNPNVPPKSIRQLDAMAKKLTRFDSNGDIIQAGFLPTQPGWWSYYWGIYFGNHLYDWKTGGFNIDTAQQIAAYKWVQGFARSLGTRAINAFQSGFGQFNSRHNPFMNGELAMEEQGPFFANFIHRNNPKMDGHYGVALFPCAHGKPGSAVLADSDVWVIPRHARHPRAAMTALAFFSRQDNLEYLCSAQSKPSPLLKESRRFLDHHPNPYIRVFEKSMLAPHVFCMPPSPIWDRVMDELNNAAGRIWRGAPVRATLAHKQRLVNRLVRQSQQIDAERARMGRQ